MKSPSTATLWAHWCTTKARPPARSPLPIVTIGQSGASSASFSASGVTPASGGSADFSYLWSCVPLSAGAATASFSNDTSESPTATFTSAGNYRVTVTATELDNDLTTTGAFDVTVVQALKTITDISGSSIVTLAAGGTDAFEGSDQFGNPMNVSASGMDWTETAGSFDSDGVYTAPIFSGSSNETATISASYAYQLDSPTLTITIDADQAPSFAVAPSATMDPSGTSATLSALGTNEAADDSDLTYTWSLVGTSPGRSPIAPPPGKPTQTAAVRRVFLTFHSRLPALTRLIARFTILRPWRATDSSTSVTVAQVLTSLNLSPSGTSASATAGSGTVDFSATGTDQFGSSIAASNMPTLQWSATAGQISSGGVFTAPLLSEPCQVSVSASGVSSSEPVTIDNPSPVTGGRVGQGWVESQFEQAIGSPDLSGSPDTAVSHLSQPTSGWSGRAWPPR